MGLGRFTLIMLLICGFMQNAHGCMPEDFVLARSQEKIKKRFDSVDTVLTAHLIKSRKLTIPSPLVPTGLPAEEDTFVVTRVFKGRLKKGERFALITILDGCGMSAINDPPKVLQLGSVNPRDLMKDWLLYMNSNEPTQIKDSEMTMPLSMVSVDLPILERLSRGAK